MLFGQDRPITIDSTTFYNLENYSVVSTRTISSADNRAVLEFEIIDLSDQTRKRYEANLNQNAYVSLSETTYLLSSLKSFSVMTVPFKVRAPNDLGYVTAKADVKNVGLYLPVIVRDNKRYWLDNTTSTHKFSAGILVAPMAEELSDKNTNDYFQNANMSYSAFLLSASVALTYAYKGITLAIIPLGFDYGLDKAGRRWISHGDYWFGLGLGIDTKLFGF